MSICMPLYNYARFLPEAIESALQQSYDDFELVIVDDGSTDGSFEIAGDYAARDSRVRVLSHPGHVNRGVSPTLETSYREARGDYLCTLPADDVFRPESLEQRVAALRSATSAGFSYCRYDWLDEHGRPLDMVRGESLATVQERSGAPGALEAALLVPSAPGINLLVRRSLYETLGGFRQGFLMSDWDFLLRALARTEGVFVDGPPLVGVRWHAGMSSVVQPRDESTLALFRALDDDGIAAGGRSEEPRVRALVRLQRAYYAHRAGATAEAAGRVASVFDLDPSLTTDAAYIHWWLGTREWLRRDRDAVAPEWLWLLADPSVPLQAVTGAGASTGHFGCLMVESAAARMGTEAARELRWRVAGLELQRRDQFDARILRGCVLRGFRQRDLLRQPWFLKAVLCAAGLYSTTVAAREKLRCLRVRTPARCAA